MSAAATSSPRIPDGWGLVGRAEQLGLIAAARADRAPGVVVSGPAGVGKSRVVREALAAAERGGAATVWVQGTRSAASVPLGAFAGLIPEEERSGDLLALMRRATAALRERSPSGPAVLGVDDAQSLDPTSAALVHHAATSGAAFVIATIRSGEPAEDAITSLWKDAGAIRVELGELDEPETAALVEAMVGGPVEEGVRRWIWDGSRGNALFARELVLGARAGGALEQRDGLWRLPRRPPLSASLHELVTARLVGLAPGERTALELLALGEPLRLGELVGAAGLGEVAAIEERGIVTVDGPGDGADVRLAHPLYGEVVAMDLPALRGRDVRRRLAEIVGGRRDPVAGDACRMARWLLDADGDIPLDVFMAGARGALDSADPALGAELAGRALQDGGGAEASLLLARAHMLREEPVAAEAVLAAAEGALGDEGVASRYLEQRAHVLFWGVRRPQDMRELLERAVGWWATPSWRGRVAPLRAFLARVDEGPSAALAVIDEALADAALEPEARARLEVSRVVALLEDGRTREACDEAVRTRPRPPLASLLEERRMAICGTALIESGIGWAEFGEWLPGAMADAVRGGDDAGAGLSALWLGTLRALDGRLDDARRYAAEAELHMERRDIFGGLTVARALCVAVQVARGDHDEAARALARCIEAAGGGDPPFTQAAALVRARAWGAVAAGDPPAAQARLLEAAARDGATPVHAAELAYTAMRVGASPRRVWQAVAQGRAGCDAPLVAAYADHVAGRLAGDGAALLAAADAFEAIGAIRYTVEACADAARAFLDGGREDSARRALARSRDLFARGQGGAAPVVGGLDGPAAVLTAREEQLVALARQGLSNAAIAEQLVLSVRTVESHLYRAMHKLGVGDRRDL